MAGNDGKVRQLINDSAFDIDGFVTARMAEREKRPGKVHIRFRVHAPRERKFCTKRGRLTNSCPVADGIIRALGLNDAEASRVRFGIRWQMKGAAATVFTTDLVNVNDIGIFFADYKPVMPTPPAIRDWIKRHDQWMDGCSTPKPEPARFRLVLERKDT